MKPVFLYYPIPCQEAFQNFFAKYKQTIFQVIPLSALLNCTIMPTLLKKWAKFNTTIWGRGDKIIPFYTLQAKYTVH